MEVPQVRPGQDARAKASLEDRVGTNARSGLFYPPNFSARHNSEASLIRAPICNINGAILYQKWRSRYLFPETHLAANGIVVE